MSFILGPRGQDAGLHGVLRALGLVAMLLDPGTVLAAGPTPSVEIGANDFRISDVGGLGIGQTGSGIGNAAVAANSVNDEVLVVWEASDPDNTVPAKTEIHGQRLRAGGPEVGANDFRISFTGGDASRRATDPAVAHDPIHNRYLVVWRSDDPDAFGVIAGAREVFGVLLAADGTPAASEVRISEMNPMFRNDHVVGPPAVVYSAALERFVVAWSADFAGGGQVDDEQEIFVREVDASSGAPLGVQSRISAAGGLGNTNASARQPALAYDSDRDLHLVVWEGSTVGGGFAPGEREIFGQLLEHDGSRLSEVGVDDFRISDMGGTGDAAFSAADPDVTFNPEQGEYLVVWLGEDDEGGFVDDEVEVFGQRLRYLATSLVSAGPNDFAISDANGTGVAGENDTNAVAVSYDPLHREYLVVWEVDDTDSGGVPDEVEIFGQRLDAVSGAAVGVDDFRVSDMGGIGAPDFFGARPAVAFSPADGSHVVVWDGADDAPELLPSEVEIYGQRLHAGVLFTDGFESGDLSAWAP